MQHPLVITGSLSSQNTKIKISVWAWDDGKPSLQKQHDSGRVSTVPGPVNWACLLAGSALGWAEWRERQFITTEAQAAGSYFQSSSLCGCSAGPRFSEGESKSPTALTLRKPRPDHPPTPARENKYKLLKTKFVFFNRIPIWEEEKEVNIHGTHNHL